MKQKIMYIASMAVITATILLMGYIGFLLFIDGNKIITYNGPMKISKVDYENNKLDVLIDYCKYREMPLTVYPAYIDGMIYNLKPEVSGGSKIGCYTVHRLYDLPKELPNGDFHFQVRNEFKVNQLKTVVISWESELFTVNRPGHDE